MELKDLHDNMNSAFESLKKSLAKQDEEIKKFGHAMPETKAAIDGLNSRLDEIETKMNRSVRDNGTDKSERSEGEKAFNVYLRKGDRNMSPEEYKALSTDSDPDGGYLMPRNRQTRIIERLHQFSPIRELANVETISQGDSLDIPAEGDTDFDCGWVGERSSRPETVSGNVRAESIKTHEIYANPKVTQKAIDDVDYDIEGYLERKVAQKFGQKEATAFVTGDGVTKPEGLLTHTGIQSVNSGSAAALTADSVILAFHTLPEYYASQATWLLRRLTVGTIRTFKDLQGRYLWEPSIAPGNPPTILGQPYREAIDMPLEASNSYPVLFGAFKEGYTILDRLGIRVLRDPFSSKPFIQFYTTKRVGGQVVLAESFIKIKCST